MFVIYLISCECLQLNANVYTHTHIDATYSHSSPRTLRSYHTMTEKNETKWKQQRQRPNNSFCVHIELLFSLTQEEKKHVCMLYTKWQQAGPGPTPVLNPNARAQFRVDSV